MAEAKTTKSTKKDTVKETTKKADTTKNVAEAKKYAPNDLIPCMSTTTGGLFYTSPKTRITYYWGAYGDVTELEYQDIMALKSSRASYLFNPHFVILDADILDPKRDAKLIEYKELFEKYPYMEDLFKLEADEISDILNNAPIGFVDSAYYTAAEMFADGRLADLNIIRIFERLKGISFTNGLIGG